MTARNNGPTIATESEPFVGRRLGRYQIEAVLGRGKDATVYAAHDLIIGRTVAIKILDPLVARDPDVRGRFLRDAAALSQLRHPHILPIYEVAERDGIAYLARQQTEGDTLRRYLAEVGPLSLDEAGALLRPIAVALDYAHRQGFIHGNLRPSNILRTIEGQIFLTDFIAPGEAIPTASTATTVVSTLDAPEYAAPEQVRGGGAAAAADLYVLGVILYEALTGRPPFRAEGPDESARNILTRHLQSPPPAPNTLNPALGPAVTATLLRALAKRPADRYPTGGALFFALGEAEVQDALAAEASPPVDPPRQPRRPSQATATATATATVAPPDVSVAPHGPSIVTEVPLYAQRLIIGLIGLSALLLGMLLGLLLAI
jgi:serine/threonine protein kinase